MLFVSQFSFTLITMTMLCIREGGGESFTSDSLFSEVGMPQSGRVSHCFQKLEHHSKEEKCLMMFVLFDTRFCLSADV